MRVVENSIIRPPVLGISRAKKLNAGCPQISPSIHVSSENSTLASGFSLVATTHAFSFCRLKRTVELRQINCQILRHAAVFRAMKISRWLIPFIPLLVGCTSVKTHSWSKTDLHSYKHPYVETASNDSAHIDQLIAGELQRLGFDASAGVRTMRPDNADLLVTYDGQWEWDFRLYLIQLNLTVSSVSDGHQLATGSIVHPGATSKSPDEMVREVLTPLFGTGKK